MLGSIPYTNPPENGLALIQREMRVVQLLFEISQTLNKDWNLEEAVQPVLRKMAEYAGMRGGTITVLNRETGEIEIDIAYGLSSEERSSHRYSSDEGITVRVVETGIPAIVEKTSQEPFFLDGRYVSLEGASRKTKNDIAFICAPILGRNGAVGAITAQGLFSEEASIVEAMRLLTTIASLLAQAVEIRREAKDRIHMLLEEKQRLQRELHDQFKPGNVIGNSDSIRRVLQLINQVSCSHANILMTGEIGVGKGLVAETIHASSPRAGKPFLKVNLANLHESTIESELFGRSHGAFIGPGRKGCFEIAEGGTLFLDEVALLPMPVQARLLRALQEREFDRAGGETVKVDVRVISATNRNLEDLVKKSQVRLDLFYRLNIFPIFVPPLRERKIDIPLLVDYFMELACKKHGKSIHTISTSAVNLLMNYYWPGNVEELENCIERAVRLSTDGVIRDCHLPPTLQPANAADTPRRDRLNTALAEIEQEMIVNALVSVRGNAARAARFLGISEALIRRRLKKFGIDSKRLKQTSKSLSVQEQ